MRARLPPGAVPGSQAAAGSGATARILAAMWSTPPLARAAARAARSRITCDRNRELRD